MARSIRLVITSTGEGDGDSDHAFTLDDTTTSLLEEASSRFRACINTGFREAEEGTVSWEVDTLEERAILCELIEKAIEGPATSKKRTFPRTVQETTDTFLVANRFCFKACMEDCKAILRDPATDDEALAIITGVPELEYQDPAVQELLSTASARIMQTTQTSPFSYFVVNQRAFYDDVSDMGVVDDIPIHPNLLALPPMVLAAGLKVATTFSANSSYMLIRCYLKQSPHCEGMEEAQKIAIFGQMVNRLVQSASPMTPDFVTYVVGACPYALKTGIIPEIVASNLIPFGRGEFDDLFGLNVTADVRREDLQPLQIGQSKNYFVGIHRGVPLFVQVLRKDYRPVAEHESVDVRIVTLYPGSSEVFEEKRKILTTSPLTAKCFEVNGDIGLTHYFVPQPIQAMVYFEKQRNPPSQEKFGYLGSITDALHIQSKWTDFLACDALFPSGTMCLRFELE